MKTDRVFRGVVVSLLTLGVLEGTGRADFACTTTVARKGDSALGEGTFFRFVGVSLNDSGLVAFTADRVRGGGPGVFAKPSVGTIGPIGVVARRGRGAPTGGTFAGPFSSPSVNASGTVAFTAGVTSAAGIVPGIFKGVPGALEAVALAGDPAPVCGGQFASFGAPSLDRDGAVAFSATLSGSASPSGVFVAHADRSVLAVACADVKTVLDDGSTVDFDAFDDAVMSAAGSVAFIGSVATDAGGVEGYTDAVYRFDETSGRIDEIARVGDPVPDVAGSTFYKLFSPPAISAAGVGFRAFVTGAVYQGIFFQAPGAAVASVVVNGDPVPGSNGSRFRRFVPPSMNDAGDIATEADNLASSQRQEVIFVPAGGSPENVATDIEAAPVPEAGVVFKNFNRPALNNHRVVVFVASLSGGRASSVGIFLCERR